MNSLSKLALTAVLVAGASTTAFAAPDRILELGDTVTPTTWTAQKTIAAPAAVLDYLKGQGVSGALDASLGTVDSGASDALETFLANSSKKYDFLAVLEPLMVQSLVWGSVDSVEVKLGRHVFNLTERASS